MQMMRQITNAATNNGRLWVATRERILIEKRLMMDPAWRQRGTWSAVPLAALQKQLIKA